MRPIYLLSRLQLLLLSKLIAQQRTEAIPSRSGLLPATKIELALEFQTLYSVRVVIHLHNVSRMEMTKQCPSFVVRLSQVLAID